MRVRQWASFGSRRTIRGGEAVAACGSSGNASAWPAPRESRVDDDGQLSRFALLRLVGLDGSRSSRECSSNTQGGSVSMDGKQPLAITSSRTHAGKLAEATRLHQRHADSPLGCTGKEAQGQISPTFGARPWSVAPKAPLEVIGWPLVTTANSPLLSPPCLDLLPTPSRKRAVSVPKPVSPILVLLVSAFEGERSASPKP